MSDATSTPATWRSFSGSGLASTRLGFGLGRTHRLLREADRLRLLAIAYDLGVRYFDAARMYGDGLSEHDLGVFARTHHDVVVATKFGRRANRLVEAVPTLRYGRMAIMRALVAAKRVGPNEARITARELRASAEKSLRALRRDRIDVLYAHEPTLASLAGTHELEREIDALRTSGKVRFFGFSGSAATSLAFTAACPSLGEVLQVEDSVDRREADVLREAGVEPHVTFGYFRLAQQARGERPSLDKLVPAIAARNPNGTILFSSNDPGRLTGMIRAFERCAS